MGKRTSSHCAVAIRLTCRERTTTGDQEANMGEQVVVSLGVRHFVLVKRARAPRPATPCEVLRSPHCRRSAAFEELGELGRQAPSPGREAPTDVATERRVETSSNALRSISATRDEQSAGPDDADQMERHADRQRHGHGDHDQDRASRPRRWVAGLDGRSRRRDSLRWWLHHGDCRDHAFTIKRGHAGIGAAQARAAACTDSPRPTRRRRDRLSPQSATRTE